MASETTVLAVVDVAAFARWYRCGACEVSWHGTDQECWSCLSTSDVDLHYAETHRDQAKTIFGSEPVTGTRLTRFGPRVEPGQQAATG